jgi:hypothetical protein
MKFLLSVFLTLVITVIGLPSQGLTAPITYIADLSGLNEEPQNASPGTGFARVVYDNVAHYLIVQVEFSGLLGTTTAAHIHGPTATPFAGNAGVMTQTPSFSGFPLGVTSGTYDHLFFTDQATTYNPAFITNFGGGTVTGAEAVFAAALEAGKAYLNIHSTYRPGGEIRGFLVAPVPTTLLLFGTGLAGLAGIRLRRKKQ